jgi:hypothetical protein
MSPVSSDISPSVTTKRQRQSNVLVVGINGSIPCKGGEGGKPLWGKPPLVTTSYYWPADLSI